MVVREEVASKNAFFVVNLFLNGLIQKTSQINQVRLIWECNANFTLFAYKLMTKFYQLNGMRKPFDKNVHVT